MTTDDTPDETAAERLGKDAEAAILLEAGSKTIAKLMEEGKLMTALLDAKTELLNRKDEQIAGLQMTIVERAADIDRLVRAREVLCLNITELNDHKALLTDALNDALSLVEHLLGELRYNNVMPRPALMLAHKQFQGKMRKLLSA